MQGPTTEGSKLVCERVVMKDNDGNILNVAEAGEFIRTQVNHEKWMELVGISVEAGDFTLFSILLRNKKEKLTQAQAYSTTMLIDRGEEHENLAFFLDFHNMGDTLYPIDGYLNYDRSMNAFLFQSPYDSTYYEPLVCCKSLNKNLAHTLTLCLNAEEALCKCTEELPKEVGYLILNIIRRLETMSFGSSTLEYLNKQEKFAINPKESIIAIVEGTRKKNEVGSWVSGKSVNEKERRRDELFNIMMDAFS